MYNQDLCGVAKMQTSFGRNLSQGQGHQGALRENTKCALAP
jgi:hypothetical protein